MPSKKQSLPKKVTRQFLMDLANDIYNTKTRRFLRLCDGTLQNGPDPTDEKRPMHCGLGELYFAMTGRQPNDDGVNEDEVVRLAIENSPLIADFKKQLEQARVQARKITSKELREAVLSVIDDDYGDPWDADQVTEFQHILDEIPKINDGGSCENGTCTYEDYRSRSQQVAAQLRKAAKLLPA